jgi:hypothetical protein
LSTKAGKKAELFLTNPVFMIYDGKIKKITEKIEEATHEEFQNIVQQQKGKSGKIDKKILDILGKELGEFEVIF